MNKHIARIQQLETQLAALHKLLNTDDYLAAGLTIGLHQGPLRNDEDYDIQVEITNNLQPIIKLINNSLNEQILERFTYARSELAELHSFISERDKP